MEKINFINNQQPAINDTNLNKLQDNVEDAIGDVQTDINNKLDKTSVKNTHSTSIENVYSCNYVNELKTHSTTDTIAGTWIDNKPIYRRILAYTPSTFTNNVEMDTGITNISTVTKMDATVHVTSDSGWRNIPWLYSTANFPTAWVGGFFLKTNGKIFFQLGTNMQDFDYLYVIVEYTKTTD